MDREPPRQAGIRALTALVVDDDARVGWVVARALARDFVVVMETDPLRATARLHARFDLFDLVVCDLCLPEPGVNAVLEAATKFGCAVVICSGADLPAALSAFPFVRKPFVPESLVATALTACGRSS